jgi:CRP-like cAMP-binding protein
MISSILHHHSSKSSSGSKGKAMWRGATHQTFLLCPLLLFTDSSLSHPPSFLHVSLSGASLDMMALFLFMAVTMLSAQSAVAFTPPCPSRLGFSLPQSSPCPRELMLRGISSVHSKLSASSPASDSNQDKDDFTDSLETQKKRDAILGTAMFQQADRVIVEALVQTMEKLQVQKDEHIIQQGQASDGSMYIVVSGTFECVDEVTGKVKKVLKSSELFGELAPKFGTKRALTVKASSNDATVWRIPYLDFIDGIKSKTDAFDASLVTAIKENPEYASYFAMEERTDVFRKCPFFKPLQGRDFDEVVQNAELRLLAKGEVLFKQGDEGDTMYVVKEGSIDIVSEKSKQILKTCKKGDSFGELAIFFSESNQRQASAVVAESCQLWEVNKDVLFSAAQESDLSEQALNAYREAHKDKRFSFEEFWEYLKIKSRPKKKPVSFHSTFTIFSTGVACAALGQLFHPGIGQDGYLHIVDLYQNLSESSAFLLEISAWMLAAASVMGILRLPTNSPNNRKFLFESWMWLILSCAATLSSSFNLHPTAWLYDGFELPGTIIISATSFMAYVTNLQLIDDAIAGSNKGREANPLLDNRVKAIIFSLISVALLYLLEGFYLPYIFASNAEEYSALATTVTELGANSMSFSAFFGVIFQVSIGALLATLQFEKKIDPKTGAMISFFVLFLLNYDGLFTLFFPDSRVLAVSTTLNQRLNIDLFPAFTYVFIGGVVVTVVQALWKRAQLVDVESESPK